MPVSSAQATRRHTGHPRNSTLPAATGRQRCAGLDEGAAAARPRKSTMGAPARCWRESCATAGRDRDGAACQTPELVRGRPPLRMVLKRRDRRPCPPPHRPRPRCRGTPGLVAEPYHNGTAHCLIQRAAGASRLPVCGQLSNSRTSVEPPADPSGRARQLIRQRLEASTPLYAARQR